MEQESDETVPPAWAHAGALRQGPDGRVGRALRELIEKYAEREALQIAEAYACRGDADSALEWLERAYVQRDPGLRWVKPDPLVRDLHADPRWPPFLEKTGLADS